PAGAGARPGSPAAAPPAARATPAAPPRLRAGPPLQASTCATSRVAAGPIADSRAGRKASVASSVHPRLISSSWPMLAVPGCADSASVPNADPVVHAENVTARAVAEPSIFGRPARQFITK